MKKYFLPLMGVLVLSAPSAFGKVPESKYGDAGCGLGSLIFGSQSGVVQVLAVTTNGTSSNQDFGITSGTSNCDNKPFNMAERQQEMFVTQNFNSLAKEMAAGEGEQLDTLAGLLGCRAEYQARFNALAQNRYEAIFVSDQTTPASLLRAVKEQIARDPELSTSCRQ